MTKTAKVILLSFVLIAAIALGVYLLTRPVEKPFCNCVFPNTGEYGVKKNGECVVTDCKRKDQSQ